MKHFWMAVSVGCISGAALALWRQRLDAAFVLATVGALAWFLNYRIRMKELIADSTTPSINACEPNESNED